MNNESKTVVILFRHGLAGDRLQFKKTHNKPDELRPLTKEGKFEVRTMAKVLSKMYGNIDSIYFSPYKRTKQTARILNKTIAAKKMNSLQSLKPEGRLQDLNQFIFKMKKKKVSILVGHEPGLSQLMSFILTNTNESFAVFKKASFAIIEITFSNPLSNKKHIKRPGLYA